MSKDNGGPASDKIQQTRRVAFEKWWAAEMNIQIMDMFRFGGGYQCHETNRGWLAFKAALDCVVIELPDVSTHYEHSKYMHGVRDSRAAIESTNLGIKVK